MAQLLVKNGAEPSQSSLDPSGGDPDEPIYFVSGERKLFGWLHHGNGESASTGVVICKPFGYEALCGHGSVRVFAEAIAALGLPTLRFDCTGTGDSADIDPKADQLDVWVKDILAAIAELRRRARVDRVCLLGFRMGALLATLAARQCEAVSGLVLIAPIVSGRRYKNELRTTWLAANSAAGSTASGGGTGTAQVPSDGSMEISGYPLAAATITSLASVDFMTLESAPAANMLVIDRADLPVARAWTERLSSLGARVQYGALPGFVEMMLTAPQFANTPKPIVSVTCEWLQHFGGVPAGGAVRSRSVARSEVPGSTVMSIRVVGPSSMEVGVTERPVNFGPDGLLFGILTEPRRDEMRRRGVILLNAGADYHIGASRMNVSLARRWAARGYFVLRMDLAGIGDSGTRGGCTDNEVFPVEALDDIRAAIDLLNVRWGVRDVTLAGLCSGAYHALRAAAAGLAVSRILMVNPQNYYWKPGMSLDGLQLVEVVHNPSLYRERLLSLSAWRRLLSGQVNIWRIVKIYSQRPIVALESVLRSVARKLRWKLPDDLGRELKEIAARGVRIVFVFARGEPGIELLRIQAGSAVEQLGDHCRVHLIDSADHTFSRSAPRAALEEALSQELFTRHIACANAG